MSPAIDGADGESTEATIGVTAPSTGEAVDAGPVDDQDRTVGAAGPLLTASAVNDRYRNFAWESGDVEALRAELGAFYGVDGRLAEATVAWAVWGQLARSDDGPVLVDAVGSVTVDVAGEATSGVLVVDAGQGPERLPFWWSGQGELVVASSPAPDSAPGELPESLGPELAALAARNLPEEGVVVLAHGTAAFFTVDGTPLGHLPPSVTEPGAGSLIDWLAVADRRIKTLPPVTGEYPCFETDLAEAGLVALCGRDDGPVPSIEVDGTELITERHWSAFYEETGWSWEQAAAQSGVIGHYRTAEQDPASEAWLLDWSGECEISDGLLFHDDRLEHVSGLAWEDAPSAVPVGWADGSVVYVTNTEAVQACGAAVEQSAVYSRRPGADPSAIWTAPTGEVQALIFAG